MTTDIIKEIEKQNKLASEWAIVKCWDREPTPEYITESNAKLKKNCENVMAYFIKQAKKGKKND